MKALELAQKIQSGEVVINTSSLELKELDSWSKERSGKYTASKILSICSKSKDGNGISEAAKKFVREILGERMGDKKQNFTSEAMQLGIDSEPICAEILSKKYDKFEHLGNVFFNHPVIENSGASPDFTCEINGIKVCGDIKTAATIAKFLEYCDSSADGKGLKKISKEYYYQVQWQIECTGATSGMLVAFCPSLLNSDYEYIKVFYIEKDFDVINEIKESIELCEFYANSILSKIKK